MNRSPNASRAGGLKEVIPADVLRNLADPRRKPLRCDRCNPPRALAAKYGTEGDTQ
jgi:hypothetical protein